MIAVNIPLIISESTDVSVPLTLETSLPSWYIRYNSSILYLATGLESTIASCSRRISSSWLLNRYAKIAPIRVITKAKTEAGKIKLGSISVVVASFVSWIW